MDLYKLAQDRFSKSYEHDKKPSAFVKNEKFIDQLKGYICP